MTIVRLLTNINPVISITVLKLLFPIPPKLSVMNSIYLLVYYSNRWQG